MDKAKTKNTIERYLLPVGKLVFLLNIEDETGDINLQAFTGLQFKITAAEADKKLKIGNKNAFLGLVMESWGEALAADEAPEKKTKKQK